MASDDALKMTAEKAAALPDKELAEVLKAWVKAGKAELPTALAAQGNKLAKKALYQLRSSGVAVPEAAAAKAAPAPAPAAVDSDKDKDDLSSGILSHVLGTGERALFFARPQRGGGLELYQTILHDENGILQFERAESNRSAFRKRLKEVRTRNEPVLIVDFERVKLELGRAWQRNIETKTPLPQGADGALNRLEVRTIEKDEQVPALEAGDEALAARGAQLFDEDEIGQWLPPEAQIRVLGARVDEVNASPLSLTPVQKKQQVDAKVEATAAEFLTPPMRALYALRLWRTAEIFEATGRKEPAQLARGTARALAAGKGATAFVNRFFARVIELSEKAQAEQIAEATQGRPGAMSGPPGAGRLIVP